MTEPRDRSGSAPQTEGQGPGPTLPPRRPDVDPGAPGPLPVPWHFKLIAVASGVYIALRIVQMLGWIGVSVKDLHSALALFIIALNAAVGLWGVLAWWRGWTLIRGFMYLALLGWWAYLPQVALGIALYAGGHRAPTGWQHYIYGIGAAIGLAVGSFYRHRLPGREGMLYGLVCLFMMGVGIRAFMTGHG